MNKILLIICVLVLSSCKYGITFGELKKLDDLKVKVESITELELTNENQVILRSYFSKLKDLAYEYSENSWMQKYVHSNFTRYYSDSLCNELLISEKTYQEIDAKCSVSGFYICAEEVRVYKDILRKMKSTMLTSEMEAMSSNSECSLKLSNLGLL